MQPESGVVATKVGTECFTLDANWILVSKRLEQVDSSTSFYSG